MIKNLLKDDHAQAYVAVQWGGGMSQAEIARNLGLLNRRGEPRTSTVNRAIALWLKRWSDCPKQTGYYSTGMPTAQGEARRELVPRALDNFLRALGDREVYPAQEAGEEVMPMNRLEEGPDPEDLAEQAEISPGGVSPP